MYAIFKRHSSLKRLIACAASFIFCYYFIRNSTFESEVYSQYLAGHEQCYLYLDLLCLFILLSLSYTVRLFFNIILAFLIIIQAPFLLHHFPQYGIYLMPAAYAAATYILLLNIGGLIWSDKNEYPEPKESMNRERLYFINKNRLRKLIMERNDLQKYSGKCATVYGLWGSGKTHFINYIKYHLSRKENDKRKGENDKGDRFDGYFSIAHVDLWSCRNTQEAWERIVKVLCEAVLEDQIWHKGFFHYLISTCERLAHAGNANIAAAIAAIIFYGNKSYTGNPVRIVRECIAFPESKRAILLIIDDVERANLSVIKGLLPLLNRLREIPGLLTLCAVSTDSLRSRLNKFGYDDDNFSGVSTKLFDLHIELPAFTPHESQQMLRKHFQQHYPACVHAQKFFNKKTLYCDTPRQILLVGEIVAKCEEYYMIPNNIEDKDFIYLPMHKEEYNQLIFTVELMKHFFSDVIPSFSQNNSYNHIVGRRGTSHSLQPEDIRDMCQNEIFRTFCPFLNTERSNSQFFCSLFALFFNAHRVQNHEDIINSTYSSSSYISCKEGCDIITSAVDANLCDYIQNTIPRHFTKEHLPLAINSLFCFATELRKDFPRKKGLSLIEKNLTQTLTSYNREQELDLLKKLYKALLSHICQTSGIKTTHSQAGKLISRLLKSVHCDVIYNFLNEYRSHSDFCEQITVSVLAQKSSGSHMRQLHVQEAVEKLSEPFRTLMNNHLKELQNKPQQDESDAEIMFFIQNFQPIGHELYENFRAKYSNHTPQTKFMVLTSLISQIIKKDCLLHNNLTLIQFLGIQHSLLFLGEKEQIHHQCGSVLRSAAEKIHAKKNHSEAYGELAQIIEIALKSI